ncbi:MAG: isoamylase early set domain-containing protein [Nitrospirae bacterium]|nr:isoamylase early set domain-containing protein [Nitrospirota bacterium]
MRIVTVASLLLWCFACSATLKPERPKSVSGGTRFLVSASAAKSVSLVGSFNGWSPSAHRMEPVGSNGLWSVVVPLPEGEHAFMYLIDGTRWIAPPLAQDFVTDGFGNTNGIVVVR